MRTEITEIQMWWRMYTNPKTTTEFYRAEKELLKVQEKYGTIDINIIKQLINLCYVAQQLEYTNYYTEELIINKLYN